MSNYASTAVVIKNNDLLNILRWKHGSSMTHGISVSFLIFMLSGIYAQRAKETANQFISQLCKTIIIEDNKTI